MVHGRADAAEPRLVLLRARHGSTAAAAGGRLRERGGPGTRAHTTALPRALGRRLRRRVPRRLLRHSELPQPNVESYTATEQVVEGSEDSHLVALSSQAKHWQGAKKASSSFVERFSCLTYPSVTNMEATSHPLPSRLCPSPALCKFDSMQVISFLGFPGSMTGKPSTHMVGECRLH